MQEQIDYNFLIIGRSGSGKSATSKLLTGDPSITVANSIHQVTKSVKFYRGISHLIGQEQIRFGILDIPGLDRIQNRFAIRQCILEQLEKLKISLHGIIYVASLTERDTIDQLKIFKFLEQLPWPIDAKKSSLLPIFTKYDNFVIDSPDQDIEKTKYEFSQMFSDSGFENAWSKRVYWINYTKSLDFKMKMNEDIREKHENQVERLVTMIRKNKNALLTAAAIREYIQKEQKYVLEEFVKKIREEKIPYALVQKKYKIPLQIKLQPSKFTEGITAVSISSIGVMISRALKRDIPTPISLIMMGIPLTLTLVKLFKGSSESPNKLKYYETESFNHKILQKYNGVFKLVNTQIEHEWNSLYNNLKFSLQANNKLKCSLNPFFKYLFFNLESFSILDASNEIPQPFSKVFSKKQGMFEFEIAVPKLEDNELTWEPVTQINYKVKAFDEEHVMRTIEALQQQFNEISKKI